MARKVGQIIARGDRRWLIPVYLGRHHETKKRNYHNRTIHGPTREAQAYLTRKLRERDLGRDLEGAKITLNEYLDVVAAEEGSLSRPFFACGALVAARNVPDHRTDL